MDIACAVQCLLHDCGAVEDAGAGYSSECCNEIVVHGIVEALGDFCW